MQKTDLLMNCYIFWRIFWRIVTYFGEHVTYSGYVTCSQHVTYPEHKRGHILDVVLSDTAFSGHYCVSFKITVCITTGKGEFKMIKKCCINDNTCRQLI